jgi:sugar O-acyltransferase (sialic acid O-acetyltransferase NeuD family)
MPKQLIIFPCNGNGLEALDCIDPGFFDFIGFVDDNFASKQDPEGRWKVESRSFLKEHPEALVLAVPGGPDSFPKRKEYIDGLGISAGRFATVIHPGAMIGRNVKLGINSLVMGGVVITSNAEVGDHVCILPNTVIHHDAHIGDYTLVGSSVVVAGGTSIGINCYIGSGSTFINGISIGDFSLVGIGSNVIRSFPSRSRIAGNPAKEIPLKNVSTHG